MLIVSLSYFNIFLKQEWVDVLYVYVHDFFYISFNILSALFYVTYVHYRQKLWNIFYFSHVMHICGVC